MSNVNKMYKPFSHPKPTFGLDINDNSFKIVQLEKKGSGLALKAYTDVVLPKGVMANDAIADKKTFSHLLKDSLDKCQFGQLNTDYAVVNLPEQKSFVRVIQIPQMSDSEADAAVPVEAESFIPLPVDQVYLDWQKTGDTVDKMNVLMVASPRDFVDQYLEVLDGAGIKPAVLEAESQSCVRSLLPPGSKETLLIVDMNAFHSTLIMVEEGSLQFTSTVPIAGNNFTESIAKILGVGSAKAEEIKKKVGLANTTDYPNIKISLLPVLSSLAAEIKSILRFHSEHSDKQVTRIILSGGSARLKNIADFIQPEFSDFPNLKVELGNPWAGTPGIKNPPLDAVQSLSFATAIGLAVRGADFVP